MTKDNPFPGMNPFLEPSWPDVHTKLITYASDEIAVRLPDDLSARSEEAVTLLDPERDPWQRRADVAVVESWKSGVAPRWQPGQASAEEGAPVATEPLLIRRGEETERWIEIRDRDGRLVTVIEILSPYNKGDGAADYRKRREDYTRSRVNLVEIDLLRGGSHVVTAYRSSLGLRTGSGTAYLACVGRAARMHLLEGYVTPLREPLPVLSIPLRESDRDVLLPLQPLVDRCHRMGAYWNADYTTLPSPEWPPEEIEWINGRLRDAGLLPG